MIDICTCSCHTGKYGLIHMLPCCHRCHYCDERIWAHLWVDHARACESKLNASGESHQILVGANQ